jgi:energy-coupling factor transporter ATP-binding protein EcfA2
MSSINIILCLKLIGGTKMKNLLLQIYNSTKDKNILTNLKEKNKITETLVKLFDISTSEANLLRFLIAKSVDNPDGVTIKKYCNRLTTEKYLEIIAYLISLENQKLITTKPNSICINDNQKTILDPEVKVEGWVLKKLIKQNAFEDVIKLEELQEEYEILNILIKPITELEQLEISFNMFVAKLQRLIDKIPKTSLTYKILSKYSFEEQFLFLYLIFSYTQPYFSPDEALNNYIHIVKNDTKKHLRFLYKIINKELPIIKDNIIMMDNNYPSTSNLDISLKINDYILTKLFYKKRTNIELDTLIFYEYPSKKQLIYNENIESKIKILRDLIQLDKIKKVLIYGESGTGKTTTAHHLAYLTNKKLATVSQKSFLQSSNTDNSLLINKVFSAFNSIELIENKSFILLIDDIERFLISNSKFLFNKSIYEFIEHIKNFKGILIVTVNELEKLPLKFKNQFDVILKLKLPDKTTIRKFLQKNIKNISSEEIKEISNYPVTYYQLNNLVFLYQNIKGTSIKLVLNNIF